MDDGCGAFADAVLRPGLSVVGSSAVAKSRMGPWERGSNNTRWTAHRIRRSRDGEVTEEAFRAAAFYPIALAAVAVCLGGWWWQLHLDSWARAVVLTGTIVLTLYLVTIFVVASVVGAVMRLVRNV